MSDEPQHEKEDASREAEQAPIEPSRSRSSALRPLGAALVAALGVGGIAASLAHCTRARPVDARSAELIAGAAHYEEYCALCHGAEGEGYAADNANALANQDFLVSVSDEFLRVNIAEGHPGTPMAAYHESRGGPLDDVKLANLVAFIRGWQEEPTASLTEPGEGDIERGAEVYSRRCASCHGDEGQGVSAVSLNNPQFLATASDAQIRHAISEGRRGTPMPAFAGDLSPRTLDDLTALIRSWERDTEEREIVAPEMGPDLVIHPDGEAPEFSELREGRYVPSTEVAAALEQGRRLVILDARPPSDYVMFHIPGAVPAPYYEIEELAARIPKDGTWVIAYCACPHAASGRVMDYLRDEGFPNTAVLDEGVLVWRDEGFPIVEGEEPGEVADAE